MRLLQTCYSQSLRYKSQSFIVINNVRRLTTPSRNIDFQSLDQKWQARWQDLVTASSKAQTSSGKPKKYVLPMFAYPSGSLHMGHLRVYTISDVLARYTCLRGNDVLHPTGWDAFGLPAENAAIERGIDPEAWTLLNIEKMKAQLKSMNTSFNWENEISTCSPTFYKHTQKLFLMLYKKGLAYQAEALVNYDPVDKTVLANEQVDNEGRSWRSGAIVEQRMLKQWFLRITAFQGALLDDLDVLAEDGRWPDRVIQQQRHWIGRSNGATITFDVISQPSVETQVKVFTTRPDTLFGVQYLALSLSHPIVQQAALSDTVLAAFIARKASFEPDSREGYRLSVLAKHPASKISSTALPDIPVFAAPYILEGYGEGAVMGVPAHDIRDFSFWAVHNPDVLPKTVIMSSTEDFNMQSGQLRQAYTKQGVLNQFCGQYAGINSEEAGTKIVKDLEAHGTGQMSQTWRLRDWLISRQRYWGCPIPIIHCDGCGAVPVPDNRLPVELPKLGPSIQGQKGNPLDSLESFVNVDCPSCGKPAKRETDTMDTFVDSSWYYARFLDPKNPNELFSRALAKEMLPVNMYIGGVEHAILHLLYARFIFKFLCEEGLIDSSTDRLSHEPFSRLIAQGMVHGKTYSDPVTRRFMKPEDLVEQEEGKPPLIKTTGKEAAITWEKMSKSKHNGVDPVSCFQKYGADVTRAHMLFAAPLSEVLQWDEEKIVGIRRWLYRLGHIVDDFLEVRNQQNPGSDLPRSSQDIDLIELSPDSADILLLTNSTIQSVTNTIENNVYNINTVISDLIKLTNAISEAEMNTLDPSVAHVTVLSLVKMLAPIAPAFAEQCWEDIHKQSKAASSIFTSTLWPEPLLTPEQEQTLTSRKKSITCAVQINGKLKFTIPVPGPPQGQSSNKEHEAVVLDTILHSEQGKQWLLERNDWENRKKVIVVKGGKLVNIVF